MTTSVTLHEGDNRDHLRRLIAEGVRVHSVVTDPPYGLTSITKRFGKDGAAKAKFGKDGAFARASAGFMGSKWDGTGIERDPEFWRLIHDILLPGGYVVAFSGSRTGHWQACAMEMAGFIMHPFLGWVYGSGMPKDHDAAKAIDKHLGRQGTVVPEGEPIKRMIPGADQHATGSWIKDNGRLYQPGQYLPATSEAEQWDGWGYGGQALKPALEPIYVGQKPFSEKNGPLNLMKHGVGAINIDACRVNGDRHPANLLHDGSDEAVALFPESKGQQGDVRGTEEYHTGDDNTHCYGEYGRIASSKRGDSGSAARFFNAFPDTNPIRYQAKATKFDRAGSKHPTVKPIALPEWLITLVTPPGGTVLDPFAGSGTTGQAAKNLGFDCILMEAEPQFAADIRRRFDLACPELHFNSEFDDLLGGDSADEPEDILG